MKRDIFQALADPTRRMILLLLATQAMTPNAIAAKFDVSRQAVSRHIHFLQECDLITPEPQGREIIYHIQAEKMEQINQWLQEFKKLLNKRFIQLDEVLNNMKP
jgi:DNA-binding transcriptional ArsR family regulator